MSPDVLHAPGKNGYAAHPDPPASRLFLASAEEGAKSAATDVAHLVDSLELDEPTVQRIKELPKEVGVMLLSVGVVGFVLPGMMGIPALMAGGLVLWPRAFNRLETWFARRKPVLHHQGMRQIGRFLDDLERRYPPASPTNQPR